MSDDIRVRFAPSPTGPLHVGGLKSRSTIIYMQRKITERLF